MSKPTQRDIFYFRQRQKNRLYQSVSAHFEQWARRGKHTKQDLAELSNRGLATITNVLSGPGNWTHDTISDLLLAMDAELKCEIVPISNE